MPPTLGGREGTQSHGTTLPGQVTRARGRTCWLRQIASSTPCLQASGAFLMLRLRREKPFCILRRVWRQCSVVLLDLLAPQIRAPTSRPLSRFRHWNTVEVAIQGRGIGHFMIATGPNSPLWSWKTPRTCSASGVGMYQGQCVALLCTPAM